MILIRIIDFQLQWWNQFVFLQAMHLYIRRPLWEMKELGKTELYWINLAYAFIYSIKFNQEQKAGS